MLTCLGWNTKISARETNYGTRVDYILITPGLLPWVKHGDIQPSLKGSDHCPIYIDLHDEIQTPDGRTLNLKQKMGSGSADSRRQPPRLSSKFWDEYSGKQKLLSSFFGKGKISVAVAPDPVPSSSPSLPPSSQEESVTLTLAEAFADTDIASQKTSEESAICATTPLVDSPSLTVSSEAGPLSYPFRSVSPEQNQPPDFRPANGTVTKRKHPNDASPAASSTNTKTHKKKKTQAPNAEQTKLSTFFAKPGRREQGMRFGYATSSATAATGDVIDVDVDEDADFRLALQLSQEEVTSLSQSSSARPPRSPGASKAAWSDLFAKNEAPLCIVHGEPTRTFTVNKAGPNKGRAFFVCSR